jgi:DNA-binding NarL/FixJ family response regulator
MASPLRVLRQRLEEIGKALTAVKINLLVLQREPADTSGRLGDSIARIDSAVEQIHGLLNYPDPAELELALAAAASGEGYLSAAVSKRFMAGYAARAAGEDGPLELLTCRQREILQLLAEGQGTKQIARLLQISVKTVETHRAQLMDRLGIHNVPGLVRFAIRNGLVAADR